MIDAPFQLLPGKVIGILGGGQLARLMSLAAAKLGQRVHIFAPDDHPPAADIRSPAFTRAAYDDAQALRAFAASVDVVTYEFENVPARTAEILTQSGLNVFPPPRALDVSQDRVAEKTYLNELGIETAPFFAVDSFADLQRTAAELGYPAILKTRRLGYDGKGQARIKSPEDLEEAWSAIKSAPAILEGQVDFVCELSVVAARNPAGETAFFDLSENVHESGVLRRSMVPARDGSLDAKTEAAARYIAKTLLEALDYVGVLAVELFLTRSNTLLVNEIAPRVHNSGHWTLDACAVSQFEQHIRAVCGWPLGRTDRHSNAVMENLLGDEANTWRSHLADPAASVHLYGKRDIRAGRKMGHVTRLAPRTAD